MRTTLTFSFFSLVKACESRGLPHHLGEGKKGKMQFRLASTVHTVRFAPLCRLCIDAVIPCTLIIADSINIVFSLSSLCQRGTVVLIAHTDLHLPDSTVTFKYMEYCRSNIGVLFTIINIVFVESYTSLKAQ